MVSGEADKLLIKTLAVKNEPSEISLIIAQYYSLEFLRRRKLFLAQYLYQKKISEGRRRPIMHYIVWLLVPLQGQKEAVTERGLGFVNN